MKIKWGALIVDGRNKIGGQVASKNKAGAYLKNKVTPTNPNTSYQADARANLTVVSRAWSALSPAERESWNSYAAQYPYTDIFGDSKYYSGFQYYMKCNLTLLAAGQSTVDAPPSTQSVSEVVYSISGLDSPSTLELTGDLASMPASTVTVIFATGNIPPGRKVSKSDLRQIGVASTLTAGVFDASTIYGSKFGAMVDDSVIGVGTYCVNTATGLVSQLRIISATVGSV